MPIAIGVVVVAWLVLSSFHRVGPQERGVVTFLGKYSRTLTPGISLTLPAPFEAVRTVDVEEILMQTPDDDMLAVRALSGATAPA